MCRPVTHAASFLAVFRSYWAGTDRPYPTVFHSPEDEKAFDLTQHLADAIEEAGVEDGDEIKITIERTGKQHSGRWQLIQPHEYGKVEDI